MRRFITLLLLLCTNFAFGQYEPKASGELVKHTFYSLDYNETHEQANWVYYRLTPQNIGGGEERASSFKVDPKVSTRSATTADYTKSGYDRGHLCPAADMSHSEVAMKESFYMSNVSPQTPSFNRGRWKVLEDQVREWCKSKGELHIVVGGVLKEGLPQIGVSNKISIPERFYKVIYSPSMGAMIGFVMENKKLDEPLSTYAVTIDEVERIIGIDLFYQLNNEELESRIDLKKWF